MTTAILFAKSMVRKAKEVNHQSRQTKRKMVDAIEFLVLLTLPIALPIFIMTMSIKGY